MSDKENILVKKLIVGVTGASGAIYAQRLLAQLDELGVETHLVSSKASKMTIAYELGEGIELEPATHKYGINDVGAAIASGSFKTDGMIIAPCSIKTMSEIATGVTSSLLTRAADVCLKERRPLILMVRETPFHLGHLRTMTSLAEMGAIIAPPLPAFYTDPMSVMELVDQSVARVIELAGINSSIMKTWTGRPERKS